MFEKVLTKVLTKEFSYIDILEKEAIEVLENLHNLGEKISSADELINSILESYTEECNTEDHLEKIKEFKNEIIDMDGYFKKFIKETENDISLKIVKKSEEYVHDDDTMDVDSPELQTV